MSRRGSITGPLSLIVFGVVALLVQMNEVSAAAVWDWYLRWWPMLLIAIGVISVAEWWLDCGNPLPRRRHSGWLIVLLILLVLFAHAQRGLRHWGVIENLGQERHADRAVNREIPSQVSIRVLVRVPGEPGVGSLG